MTSEDKFRQERFARIRRVKRFLRPLPRRTNIHRYPFLKWFAATARKRSYLWSFRKEYVIPAIYSGTILSLLPLYGIQVPLAFVASLVFRANLMVLVGLQFITNPLTLGPLYALTYKIGDLALVFFATEDATMDELSRITEEVEHVAVNDTFYSRMIFIIKLTVSGAIKLSIGGVILGFVTAFFLSLIYQLALKAGHQYKIHHPKPADKTTATTGTDKNDD